MQNRKLIIGVEGTSLLAEEYFILKHKLVAGIILFTRNYKNKQQLKALVKDIRRVAEGKNLLIVVDQEGGNVWRFKNDEFTKIKAAEYFGILYDQNPTQALLEVYNAGRTIASELLDCGIDMSLAPVLDLARISKVIRYRGRAFHEKSEVVSLLASKFIEGMQAAGMPSCGKHFPGHGSCISDSHFSLVEDNRELQTIENEDMIPFKKLLNKLDYILVSHVNYSKVDPTPCVYSKFWLQQVLRTNLKFRGNIISDCLTMKAADIGNYLTRVTKAWDAGCNLVILSQLEPNKLKELLGKI